MSKINFYLESFGSEHSCHNEENYMDNMLGSIPHQKLCFYHLPTRGRAGIKLGDAWYDSNVSIIFDCSMLLYYPFCMFMGFTIHLYIIFGTNLLTGGLARIAVFFAYFSVSQKRNIKRNPNGTKPSRGSFFGTNAIQETWSGRQGSNEEATRQEGAHCYILSTALVFPWRGKGDAAK